MDFFPPLHPSLSLIAGPEGVGNVSSRVYHSQAELGVTGLTAWSCGGDIRRFGRGPQRGDSAFVLQTQSHAHYLFIYSCIYLFTCCMGRACSSPRQGMKPPLGRGDAACSPGRPHGEKDNGPSRRRRRKGEALVAEQMGGPALLVFFFFFPLAGLFYGSKTPVTLESVL